MNTRFDYTERDFDAVTGLYFYRSRYYDPGVGRFIGEDAIGFAGGDANLYRYVGNSSTNFTDPYGLLPTSCRVLLATRQRDPNGQECLELAKKIANVKRDIQENVDDLKYNPSGLSETKPGGKPKESVQGHRVTLQTYQNNLERLLQKYKDQCGGGDPPLIQVRPARLSPSPSPAPTPFQIPNLPDDWLWYLVPIVPLAPIVPYLAPIAPFLNPNINLNPNII
jgi:RHS repeat-associated protein